MAATSSGRLVISHRAVLEALATAGPGSVLYVSGSTQRLDEMSDRARRAGVPVRSVSRRELRRLAPDARDCALELARAAPSEPATLNEVLAETDADLGLVLVLDHITDPDRKSVV